MNGTILGAGGFLIATPAWGKCGGTSGGGPCQEFITAMQVTGAIIAALAAATLVYTSQADLPEPPPEPPGPSDEAVRLLAQARIAARLGHCENVHAIADRVAVIDPAFHAHEFADDSDIAVCLR